MVKAMRRLLIILLLLNSWKFPPILSTRVFLKRLECENFKKSHAEFKQCNMSELRNGDRIMTVYIKVLKFPVNNFQIHFQVMRKSSQREYEAYLADFTFDACKFLKIGNNYLLKYIYNVFRPYTNVNHTCPLNHDIIFKNVRIEEKRLHPLTILPTGDYAFSVTILQQNIKFATIRVYFGYEN